MVERWLCLSAGRSGVGGVVPELDEFDEEPSAAEEEEEPAEEAASASASTLSDLCMHRWRCLLSSSLLWNSLGFLR